MHIMWAVSEKWRVCCFDVYRERKCMDACSSIILGSLTMNITVKASEAFWSLTWLACTGCTETPRCLCKCFWVLSDRFWQHIQIYNPQPQEILQCFRPSPVVLQGKLLSTICWNFHPASFVHAYSMLLPAMQPQLLGVVWWPTNTSYEYQLPLSVHLLSV